MNKTIVIIIGIIVVGLLIGYYIYFNNPIIKSINGDGSFLTESEQEKFYSLSNRQNLTEDESRLFEHLRKSLIRIVEKSFALNIESTVGEIINKTLKQQKGDFRIIAWTTKGIDKQTILAKYSFVKDGNFPGWYFDVKLGGRVIRDISSDKELMEKHNVVKYTGLTDKEAAELNKLSMLYKPKKTSGTGKSGPFSGQSRMFVGGKLVHGPPMSAEEERYYYLEITRTILTQQSLLVSK